MKRNIFFGIGVLFVLLASSSCQKFYDIMRVDAKPVSDFLPGKERLTRMNSKFPFHFVYLDSNAPAHHKLYIAPVNIEYLQKDKNYRTLMEQTNGKILKDLQELAAYVRNANIDKFKALPSPQWFSLVESPDIQDSFSLELAITALTPAKGGWNILGTAGDIVLGLGTIITSQFAYGSLTIEGRVRDNNTGKIIAMFATTEQDENALIINVSNFTWLSSAKTNAKNIADYTATIFDADNYDDVKRKFPIRWIAY